MKTYTVYAPEEDNRAFKDRATDYVFIKEGYSLWAAIFGPFWLVFKTMWVEAAVFFVAIIGVSVAMEQLGFNAFAISSFFTLANIIFAFFARDIERLFYERSGYQMVSVINGKNEHDCEARYFRNRGQQQQEQQKVMTL